MTIRIPFRLQVQMNLSAAFAQISIAHGYQTDLPAANVFRGRILFGPNDPLPAVAIIEPPLALDMDGVPYDMPKQKGKWELLIQGFAVDDKKNPTDPAHILMADVKKCLAAEKKRKIHGLDRLNPLGLGYENNNRNHIVSIESIGSGVVRPPGESVSDKAYFWLPLRLDIFEDLDDPFM